MTLFVLREGNRPDSTLTSTGANANVNFNVPTNPVLVSDVNYSGDDLWSIEVRTDNVATQNQGTKLVSQSDGNTGDSLTSFGNYVNRLYPNNSTETDTLTNLEITPGYRLRARNDDTGEGTTLTSLSTLINEIDLFVCINPRTLNTVHMAKITSADNEFIEFEPAFGEEIGRYTEFTIFAGPDTTDTNVVAVSYGCNFDIFADKPVIARPLFYFYEDRLDKVNEFNHNQKLRLVASRKNSTGLETSFITQEDYKKKVIDYSKFTLDVDVIDNLRVIDDPQEQETTDNEGTSFTPEVYTNYTTCFVNSRRDSDDNMASFSSTGPYRYLNYIDSNNNNNQAPNTVDIIAKTSIGSRGAYAQTTHIDVGRLFPKKYDAFGRFVVRQRLSEYSIGSEIDVSLPVKFTATQGSSSFTFDIPDGYSLNKVLGVGDEVLIDSTVYTLASVSASAFTVNQSRPTTEVLFTASSVAAVTHSSATIKRRRWSPVTQTMMVEDFEIDTDESSGSYTINGESATLEESRLFNTYIVLTGSRDFSREFRVEFGDRTHEFLKLKDVRIQMYQDESDANNFYNYLDYFSGAFIIEKEIFFGEIENINQFTEDTVVYYKVSGRNNVSKLISPILNKDTRFLYDIVSTSYPVLKAGTFTTAGGISSAINVGDTSISFNTAIASQSTQEPIRVGQLFPKLRARIKSISGSTVTLDSPAFVAVTSGSNLDICRLDTVAFRKAQSSNFVTLDATAQTSSPTISSSSLLGASNKGVAFNSGASFTTDSAIETKLNGFSIENFEKSRGVKFYELKQNDDENSFIGKLGKSSSDNFRKPIYNSLQDFEIVSATSVDNVTKLELAPYVPLTLGRLDLNGRNLVGKKIVELAAGNTNAEVGDVLISSLAPLSSLNGEFYLSDSLYGSTVSYHGTITNIHRVGATGTLSISTDTTASSAGSNSYLAKTSQTTGIDMYLLNGEHLAGGRTLSLVSPTLRSNMLQTLQFDIDDNHDGTANTTYLERYGSNLYNVFYFEKGSYDAYGPKLSRFYTNTSKTKYHGIGYKNQLTSLQPNESPTSLDTLLSEDKAIDIRGRGPFRGTNASDFTYFGANYADDDKPFIPSDQTQNLRERFESIDAGVLNRFIYSVSDYAPASTRRVDSIFAADIDISTFDLFVYGNSISSGRIMSHSHYLGSGQPYQMLDENSQKMKISSDVSIDSLKQFSLLRLVEVTLDAHFNSFDGENPPTRDALVEPFGDVVYRFDKVKNGATHITCDFTGGGTSFTTSLEITSIAAGADLYDNAGQLLGEIASISGTTLTLVSAVRETKVSGFYSGNLYTRNSDNNTFFIAGTEDRDAMFLGVTTTSKVSLVKGAVFNNTGTKYGHSDGAFKDKFSHDISSSNVQELTQTGDISFMLPFVSTGSSSLSVADSFNYFGDNPSSSVYPIRPRLSSEVFTSFNTEDSALGAMRDLQPVIFEGFKIEDSKLVAEEGMVPVSLFQDHPVIIGENSTNKEKYVTLEPQITAAEAHFAEFDNADQEASDDTYATGGFLASGVTFGFKPLLRKTSSWTEQSISSPSGTFYQYRVQDSLCRHLKFMPNITGYYLVTNEGQTRGTTSGANTDVQYRLSSPYDRVPNEIAYVVSHKLDRSQGTLNHLIVTDKQLTNDKYYRIFRPAENCMYDFTPNKIKLFTMTPEYTKRPYANETYGSINNYSFDGIRYQDTSSGGGNLGDYQQGLLSLYLPVDPNGRGTGSDLVIRNPDHFFGSSKYIEAGDRTLYFSDGENNMKVSASFEITAATNYSAVDMTLSDTTNLVGIPSVSETFVVESPTQLEVDAKRAMIGTTVDIGYDAEDLISEIFAENDIEYVEDTNSYTTILTPDFNGVDLYSATNFLASEKNKEIIVESEKIFIREKSTNKTRFSEIISEKDSRFFIKEVTRDKSLFDVYNDVIVYGRDVRAQKQDFRSIKKIGRKTLEIVDDNIRDQNEADKRAKELLLVHSKINKKLTLEMHPRGIKILRPGDIITVDIPSQEILSEEYLVIQMTHSLTNLVTLELGQYSKLLEDRLAELFAENKKTQAAIRSKKFKNLTKQLLFLDDIKIKPVKLTVTQFNSDTSLTIGFGFNINTEEQELGVADITETVLLDELL